MYTLSQLQTEVDKARKRGVAADVIQARVEEIQKNGELVDDSAQTTQTTDTAPANTQQTTQITQPEKPLDFQQPKETGLVGGINNIPLLGGLLSGLTKYGQFVGAAGEQGLKSGGVRSDIGKIEANNTDMRKTGAIQEQARKLVELRKTNPNASIEDLQNPEMMKALERNRNYSTNASNFYTNDEIKDKLGSPADIALTGSKAIAGASSYFIPGGAGLLGKSATALGRGALMGFGDSEKGDNWGDTAKNAALGAGLGAVTSLGFQGLTSGAGKLLNKATGKISENLLNLTSAQRTKFEDKFKIDPVKLAKKFGIVKGTVDDVDRVLNPIRDQYDALAIKSGKDVLVTDVLSAFDKAREKLTRFPLGKRQKLATALDKEANLFLEKYGNLTTIPIKELTLLRRAVDKTVSNAAFAKPNALQNNIDGVERTLFKKVIDDATGGATKKIGNDMSKLITLRKLVNARKHSPIQGLMRAIGIDATGATLGAGVGYSQGRDLPSAIAGGATGLALTAGANSRTGQQALLKLLQNANKTGNGINKVTGGTDRAMQFLGGKLGGEIANLTGRQSPPQNNQGNNTNPQSDNHTDNYIPDVNTMGQTTTKTDKDTTQQPEQPQVEMLGIERALNLKAGTGIDILSNALAQAQVSGNKKAETKLQSMLSDAIAEKTRIDKDKEQGLKTNKSKALLSDANINVQKLKELYGLGTNNSLSQGNTTVGPAGGLARGKREVQKNTDQGFMDRLTAYNNTRAFAVGLINQARGAGVLNADEYIVMKENMPNEYSSEASAKEWFTNLDDLLKRMSGAGIDLTTAEDTQQQAKQF